MIYEATWADGRRAILRAQSYEYAFLRAHAWRKDDPELEPDGTRAPEKVDLVPSAGRTGILMAGWKDST